MQTLIVGVLCPLLTLFLVALGLRVRELRRDNARLRRAVRSWTDATGAAEKRLAAIEWAYGDLRARALVRNSKGQIKRASDEKE